MHDFDSFRCDICGEPCSSLTIGLDDIARCYRCNDMSDTAKEAAQAALLAPSDNDIALVGCIVETSQGRGIIRITTPSAIHVFIPSKGDTIKMDPFHIRDILATPKRGQA